jgi:hypothetical protein
MNLKKQLVDQEYREKKLENGTVVANDISSWAKIKRRYVQVVATISAATDVTRNSATPCTYTYGYSDEQSDITGVRHDGGTTRKKKKQNESS